MNLTVSFLKVEMLCYYYPSLILSVVVIQWLAKGRLFRFMLTRQRDDLEQSILGLTEAIYLPLPRKLPLATQNIVQVFFSLTFALFLRTQPASEQSFPSRPEDINSCITHLRYLREPWHEVPIDMACTVTGILVDTLAVQAALGSGDVDQDIEEMADICNELLQSDVSTNSLTGPIHTLTGAVNVYLKRHLEGQILSEKVIGCLRKAVIRLPDLHLVPVTLADVLFHRFQMTLSEDDYKEGMAIVDKIINFRSPGDRPSSYRERASELAASFAVYRWAMYGKPDYLEQAIDRRRAQLDGNSLEDTHRAGIIRQISDLQRYRFNRTNSPRDTPSNASEPAKPPSFEELTFFSH